MKRHNLDLINYNYPTKQLEKYIHLFDDDDDWCCISEFQKLSEEFIEKNINKIDIDYLMENKNISKKLKNKVKKEINLLKEII